MFPRNGLGEPGLVGPANLEGGSHGRSDSLWPWLSTLRIASGDSRFDYTAECPLRVKRDVLGMPSTGAVEMAEAAGVDLWVQPRSLALLDFSKISIR